jgi:hypothetical protein
VDFKKHSAGEVTAAVELYHDIDIIFPKAVSAPILIVRASYSAIRFSFNRFRRVETSVPSVWDQGFTGL